MGISTILVGVDHSERSDRAVRRANTLALFHDAKIVLNYALDVGAAKKLHGLLERVAAEETAELAANLLGEQCAPIEVRVSDGRPFETLRDSAAELKADLIVIGAHRVDENAPPLSGSTARRLINVAPAPVLVAAGEAQESYKSVLVGFDGSPAASAALRFARELAPNAAFTTITATMIPFSARKAEAYLVEQFESDARRMAAEAIGEGAADMEIIARVGEAYGVIREAVQERRPDLLVLGASMPALYRVVFGGGIPDLIAADPPCDLLVVKT